MRGEAFAARTDVPDSAIAPAGTDDKLTAADSPLNWRRLRKYLFMSRSPRDDELYSSEMPSAKLGIDKSRLARPEPRRFRDKEHVKFVAKQACLICGRRPADAHHLRFAHT